MMGGSTKIIAKGKQLVAEGQYLQALNMLNRLVFAEPQKKAGRGLAGGCVRATWRPVREH